MNRIAKSSLRPWVGALVILMAGCSMSADTAVAERAVPKFHESLDAEQFEAIYAAASDDLKQQGTKDEFIALLDAVHRKLGATKSSTRLGWAVNYNGAGTFVTLNYATVFAEGEAEEHFTYRVEGDKALLADYRIDSNGLNIRRAPKGGLQAGAHPRTSSGNS